jgi:phosphoglycerate dehydrogenase-like enzyme
MARILFAPRQDRGVTDIARALTPPGFELVAADFGTPEFYAAAADAEYFLGLARTMGTEFFRSAPKLKLVQLLSAGYDRVDIEAARKAGVPVANNGGANAIAVAEHTILLMLAVLKQLVRFHLDVVAGRWRPPASSESPVYELSGRTVGIVGLGNIGKKVARRAAAFDARVQYYDIVRLSAAEEDALGVRFVLLSELLRTSDIVSLHVPLTDATRRMIGARELGLMKPGAILVNTARGGLVDETALVRALEEKRIGGAALDVFEVEPLPADSPLRRLDQVVLTPHVGGLSAASLQAMAERCVENVLAVLRGRDPGPGLVLNPEVLPPVA